MELSVKWFDGQYPSFNVSLASTAGKEPFLEIKGCKIMNGSNGEFVSFPSKKIESTGKYWNHVYASKDFAAVVLEKAKESQPVQSAHNEAKSNGYAPNKGDAFEDSDLPF